MIGYKLTLATAFCLAALPAWAGSSADATAGSLSAAGSLASVNQTFQGAAPAPSHLTIHNVPDIQAPLVVGGSCQDAAGGGIAGAGFGISLGGSKPDAYCEHRAAAIVMKELGYAHVGVSIMCEIPWVADAMKTAGEDCGAPRPQAKPVAESVPPVTKWCHYAVAPDEIKGAAHLELVCK